MVPKAPGSVLLTACCNDCTQLGGSSLAKDWMSISGFESFASSTLNRPKLNPATVCGASLFHTLVFCPPSLDSRTSAPVAAIFIPFGM